MHCVQREHRGPKPRSVETCFLRGHRYANISLTGVWKTRIEHDLIGGELDLVGGELDQVESMWGRTRWGRTRHGAKPAATVNSHCFSLALIWIR